MGMQTDAEVSIRSEFDWHMHHSMRIGLPPLRFLGRVLDRQEVAVNGALLFVGLLQRKTGGFTVEICRMTDCGIWAAHAFASDTIDAAMTKVEAYCADVQDEVSLARPQLTSPIDALSNEMVRHGRLADEVGRFQVLVGQALDRWMQLAATVPGQIGGVRP